MKKGPRRPFAPLYAAANAVLKRQYRKKYNHVIENETTRGLSGPFIVLANHCSNLDYLSVALAMYPHRLNYIASSIFFKNPILRVILNLMGAIEKHQFVPDLPCLRAAMAVVRSGGKLMMFPSAQVSYDGNNADIDISAAKLVKKLGVTVIGVKTDGGYLTLPKWSKTPCRGQMRTRTFVMMTPEQLADMSVDEILQRMKSALAFNDFELQRVEKRPFLPVRPSEGLENVLHGCLRCGGDFVMKSEGSSLRCEKCGYTATIGETGLFDGAGLICDNVTDWFGELRNRLVKAIEKNDFALVSECELLSTVKGKGGYHPIGSGVVRLDHSGLFFCGTDGDSAADWHFPLGAQEAVSHTSGLGFDWHDGFERTLCFSPRDRRMVIAFVEAFSLLRAADKK